MKKFYPSLPVICFLLCLLSSCKTDNRFELQGELEGLNSDKLLIIYDDPISKLDTIEVKEGRFSYAMTPDTLTFLRLVDEEGQSIPIFAERGWQVSLEGSFSTPKVQGDGPNNDYQEFRNSISSVLSDTAAVLQLAEAFIKSHPQSFASAYLIDRYFIQVQKPDMDKVTQLIEPLDGTVKDCRVLNVILKSISSQKGKSDFVSFFSVKDRKGEYFSWNSAKDQYTLINFWASWDKTSCIVRDSLMNLLSDVPEKFKVLNISLDYDKNAWLDACKKDTPQWIEVCDYKGWDNSLIRQHSIGSLPANILVDRNRKILARNLYGEQLGEEIRRLTKEKSNNKK